LSLLSLRACVLRAAACSATRLPAWPALALYRLRVLNQALLFTATKLKVPSSYESAARFIMWLIDENDPG
jgi:hypothetical protein